MTTTDKPRMSGRYTGTRGDAGWTPCWECKRPHHEHRPELAGAGDGLTCPMTADKPSIAELQRKLQEPSDKWAALLDIVAAALAVRGQERLAARGAGQPGDLKRMRDVYEDALDKVMP